MEIGRLIDPVFAFCSGAKRVFALWVVLALVCSGSIHAEESTLKVGVLHSQTGTMAVSEAVLVDVLKMLVAQTNEQGGLLGKSIELVIRDPGSDDRLFQSMATELIEQENVDVIFGCWTSSSRKAVLPALEGDDALLFYPVQYEGQEANKNVFYLGATPAQQAIPAVEYLRNKKGIEAWILLGSDYVYPRMTNRILEAWFDEQGIAPEKRKVIYRPLGFHDWQKTVREIAAFVKENPNAAVVSTVNGDSNLSLYREFYRQKLSAEQLPVMSFSINEHEVSQINSRLVEGHFASWTYFMDIGSRQNRDFIQRWQLFNKNMLKVTNDPIEATYLGFELWKKTVADLGTTDPLKVRDGIIGQSVTSLSGATVTMLPNHHSERINFIGQIQKGGLIEVVEKSAQPLKPDPWSRLLPDSKSIETNWLKRDCERWNVETQKCEDK